MYISSFLVLLLTCRMSSATGSDFSSTVYDLMGYCEVTDKFHIGSLAQDTHPQIRVKIKNLLMDELGYSEEKATSVIKETWQDTPEDLQIKSTGPLKELFTRLKNEGIKIAICTSDSRDGCEEFMDLQGLNGLVDISVCGNDPFCIPKPDPHNAKYICEKLGVKESETLVVGDTPADTLMGQQAGLGLTVGVLCGVGGKEDLIDADVIVNNVSECVDLILPVDNKPSVHHVTSRGLSKVMAGSWFGSQPGWRSGSPGVRNFSTSSRLHQKAFSHIVVGAGSAGCVLANRLSEER